MPDSSNVMEKKKKKTQEEPIDNQEYEIIGGIKCPIDPMERLQCESCQ